MSVNVSPLCIRLMIACYAFPEPKDVIPEWNNDICHSLRNYLLGHGLIDEKFRATPRGEAWVKFICQTPLPEQIWKLPQRTLDE